MTEVDASDIVKRVLGAFPLTRQKMSRDDVLAMTLSYCDGLMDLEYADALAAVTRINKTAEFMPTIAKIRAEVMEVLSLQRKTGLQAWNEIIKLVGAMGAYRTPRVDFRIPDPISSILVTAELWRTICLGDLEDLKADRARFIDAYEELAKRAQKNIQALPGAIAAPPPKLERGGAPKTAGDAIANLLQLTPGKDRS